MTKKTKILIATSLVVVSTIGIPFLFLGRRDKPIEVRLEAVAHRDLTETVTANGNIRAGRVVDMSSDVSARVSELLIEEGDDVAVGQLLLRLDPTQFQASVSRAEASLNQASAQVSQQEASLARSIRDLDRLENIYQRDSLLVMRQQLDNLRTEVELASRQLEAFQFGVQQAEASLTEANELLSKTIFRAPISGKVTRLNVEEGETVIVGTMNNPGSLVLTISELSAVEVVLEVDETDVPYISLGDSTILELDAFPNQLFSGLVTEIGNSAIAPPANGQTSTIDFEVVVSMDNPPSGIRPDLSATADIVTATRDNSLSIPIISLTLKSGEEVEELSDGSNFQQNTSGPLLRSRNTDQEGVFIVSDGRVTFYPVQIGITGQEHFEVVSGLNVDDTIVVGPYQQIRDLEDNDLVVPISDEDEEKGFFGGRIRFQIGG
ncbi:MAG: efflux RND transporter periplasmic adaptor subunit [Gemmatimonadota bacterium]|nr:efflux RND transporter periplasmic adaptor subunit [Gemmatimonadota bacterium]